MLIVGLSLTEAIFLPIIVNGQKNNLEFQVTTDDIYDYLRRAVILHKKGVFNLNGDIHRFYVELKEGVEYVARMKITYQYGGNYIIKIQGVITSRSNSASFTGALKKQKLEVKYTADKTTNVSYIELVFTPSISVDFPAYTLYFNKAGFAGWWWIILSGFGVIAIFVVLLTFATFGMISVSKRKKKKRKKKKRK